MAETSMTPSHPQDLGASRRFTWLMGLVSFGLLAFFIVQVAIGFATAASLHRLQSVQEVVLPGIIVPPKGYDRIQAVRSDHFDFQALDPQTGRLFIAHPGPSDVKLDQLIHQSHQLPEGTQIKGTIVVVDTKRNEYVTSIDLPNIHGLVIAPDLHKVYAAGSIDDVVYSIDERTLKPTRIDVAPNCKSHKDNPPTPCENPDSLAYDPVNQKIFVSCPAGHDEAVIDAQTNEVVRHIPLGNDGKWGDGVGHTRYDSDHIFVVVVPLPNPDDPNAVVQPPSYLVTIDPVTDQIIQPRLRLPDTCVNPHGLGIDSQQQVAFIACIDSQNVVMVDLQSMKAVGDLQHLKSVGFKPDIVALDNKLHILYVGCASGISVFDESGASRGSLNWLKDYTISSSSSHSIAVDDDTHNIYIPLTDVGGRPVLWIEQYNPKGSD